ncbi:MAG TPA: hypothetical protein VEJ63_19845 [Planctomycetota bacterium]|nr:hypothetical protein [Planctomycetota bacterium]
MERYAPKNRSAAARWTTAVGLLALILMGCYYFGQVLARKVADPTPEQLQQSLTSSKPPALEELITQFNRMDVAKRGELSTTPEFREYTQKLSPEQRLKFVRETMDRGIQDQIERYRKMNKEERAAFIEEARERQKSVREQMDNATPEEKSRMREMASSGNLQDVIERAVQEFLKVTTSEERAELAPLYDGALENMRHAQQLK